MLKENKLYDEALSYVHKVEDHYGSTTKAPYSDPDLVKARKLIGINKNATHTVQEFDEMDLKIKELMEYGYQAKDIYQMLDVGWYKIRRVKDKFKLVHKPKFRYKISRDGHTVGYSPYVRGMCKLAHVILRGNSQQSKDRVKAAGFDVEDVDLRWGDLPDGAVYVTRDSKIMVKQGNDSYLKIEK